MGGGLGRHIAPPPGRFKKAAGRAKISFMREQTFLKPVFSRKAPAPAGPYSQAIQAGPWLFCSGQIPLNPQTGRIAEGDISAQARQALENLQNVLAAGGMTLKAVVQCRAFLTDMKDFPAFNKVYAGFFAGHKPARSCIQVSALPNGAAIEIEALAFRQDYADRA